MNSDNSKNNLNEREIISADEQRISDLVGRLERVSAPKDFDFRLKARISAAGENDFQPSLRRTLRYVLPLTATLIIAAFLLVQAGLFSPAANQPENNLTAENPNRPPAQSQEIPAAEEQIAQAANSAAEETPAEVKLPDTLVVKTRPENSSAREVGRQRQVKFQPNSAQKDEQINSKDFTVRPSNVQIMPEGINPANTAVPPAANEEFNQSRSLPPAREILNMIGAETEPDGKKLKVKSVKENSLAARSGVRAGDIIEAIDGRRLDRENPSPEFKGGKRLTVTREGKVLEIELKPN